MKEYFAHKQRGHDIAEPSFIPFDENHFTVQQKRSLEEKPSHIPRSAGTKNPPMLLDYHRILEEELEDSCADATQRYAYNNISSGREQELSYVMAQRSAGVVDGPRLASHDDTTPAYTWIPAAHANAMDALIPDSQGNELLSKLPSDELIQAALAQNGGKLHEALLLDQSMGLPFEEVFSDGGMTSNFLDRTQPWEPSFLQCEE